MVQNEDVLEWTIVKNCKNSDNYQVIVQMPYTKEKEKMVHCGGRYQRKNYAENEHTRKTRNECTEKLTMPITIQGRLDQFQSRGFIVTFNPKGDCQFSAVSYLLNKIGLHTSPRILR